MDSTRYIFIIRYLETFFLQKLNTFFRKRGHWLHVLVKVANVKENTSIDTVISRHIDNAEIPLPALIIPAIPVQVAVGFHDAGTLSRLRHPSRSLYVACKYDDCVGVALFDIK